MKRLALLVIVALFAGCSSNVSDFCQAHCLGPRMACEVNCVCNCTGGTGNANAYQNHRFDFTKADDPSCSMISTKNSSYSARGGLVAESARKNIDAFKSQIQ